MERIKVVLLVLVAQVVCGNPLSETKREAAETTALKENLKRMLNDREYRIKILYTSFYFPVSGASESSTTHARNTEICEGLGGRPMTLTSQRKIDILNEVSGSSGIYPAWRWMGGKRDTENGRWQWATGEDIEPSNFEWTKYKEPDRSERECLVSYWGTFDPYICSSTNGVACEVEGRRSKHVPAPDNYVVKNVRTDLFVVHDPSKNHAEAEAACNGIDDSGTGRLATPSSFKELEEIDKLLVLDADWVPMEERHDNGFWLGAERKNYGGDPTWSTGFKIVGNLRQKVGDNGGRCLLYIANTEANTGGLGKFDWVNCGDSNFSGYICQVDTTLADG